MTNRMTHSHHFLFQIQRSIVTTISNPTSIPANQTLSASATPPSQCTPTTKASAPTSSGIDASHFPHFDAFLWTTSPAIPPSSAKIAIWLAEPPQIHSKPPPNPPHFAPTSGPP
ncbi:hypothetical protein, partial [Evtepia sp.]|uniref:hypothetical protein n=1 Tax=Evtepia sp. TaxID=2773933 RepID=UPI002E7A82B0